MKRMLAMIVAFGCSATHSNSPADGAGSSHAGADAAGGGSGTSDAPATSSTFACSGSGIAAYADQLVTAARTTCTKDGVGVVKMDDYTCMSPAITQVDPPYGSASFNV